MHGSRHSTQERVVNLGLNGPPVQADAPRRLLVAVRLRVHQGAVPAQQFVRRKLAAQRGSEKQIVAAARHRKRLGGTVLAPDHQVAYTLLEFAVVARPWVIWAEIRLDPIERFFPERLGFSSRVSTSH